MTAGELAGGGPHDGMQIVLPDKVIGVAIVTKDPDGNYDGSALTKRGADVDLAMFAQALVELGLGMVADG